MPDVLEAPAESPRIIGRPFQPGNDFAHIGAAASIAARAAKKAVAGSEPAATPEAAASAVQTAIQHQLATVQEQITHTRRTLNDDKWEWCEECERGGIQPHHRAQLLKALDALLATQRKLLGIHDPGPSKAPAPPRQREARPSAEPIG